MSGGTSRSTNWELHDQLRTATEIGKAGRRARYKHWRPAKPKQPLLSPAALDPGVSMFGRLASILGPKALLSLLRGSEGTGR